MLSPLSKDAAVVLAAASMAMPLDSAFAQQTKGQLPERGAAPALTVVRPAAATNMAQPYFFDGDFSNALRSHASLEKQVLRNSAPGERQKGEGVKLPLIPALDDRQRFGLGLLAAALGALAFPYWWSDWKKKAVDGIKPLAGPVIIWTVNDILLGTLSYLDGRLNNANFPITAIFAVGSVASMWLALKHGGSTTINSMQKACIGLSLAAWGTLAAARTQGAVPEMLPVVLGSMVSLLGNLGAVDYFLRQRREHGRNTVGATPYVLFIASTWLNLAAVGDVAARTLTIPLAFAVGNVVTVAALFWTRRAKLEK